MPRSHRPVWLRLVVGIVCIGISFLIRWALWPLLRAQGLLITILPAILVASWYGGLWSGLTATGLGALGISYFFARPRWSWGTKSLNDFFDLSLYLLLGAVISVLYENLHRAQAKLQTRVKDQTAELESTDYRLATAIKAREKTGAVLLETAERYRTMVDLIPDMLFIHQDDKIVFMNPAGLKLIGAVASDEVIGKPTLEIVHPSHRDTVVERMRRIQKEAVPLEFAEQTFLRLDGTEMPVEVAAVPFTFRGKRALQVLARDITDRKRMEAQYLQAQKMEAVGRLAGGVAHDFNNLLTVIQGYSSLLIEELREGSTQRLGLKEIEQAAQRGAVLSRQLLTFSRQQMGEMRVVDLNSIVIGIENMLGRLIGEDIELSTVLAPDLGNVRTDPGHLEQLLMNLAVNARDAMPKGGHLTIETANVELDPDFTRSHLNVTPGRYVMLAVSDTGCGMDAETQSHIFEPFFTTKPKGRGTGLGLATVYGIVKQSGGTVWVYSELGKGTTLKSYFPRIASAISQEKLTTAKTQVSGGSETIVLAEDSAELRGLAQKILAKNGYAVLEANNGASALEICKKHEGPIDLVLTDVVMPGMSGRDLATEITVLRPNTRILFMSGYTDDVISHHGVLEPGIALLQKPFTPEMLLRKVRETLDRKDHV